MIEQVSNTALIVGAFNVAQKVMKMTERVPLEFHYIKLNILGAYNHHYGIAWFNTACLDNAPKDYLIHAVVHELQHVKQSREKRIIWNNDEMTFTWEDDMVMTMDRLTYLTEHTEKEYLRLPWEKEANAVANTIAPEVAELVGYKDYNFRYGDV